MKTSPASQGGVEIPWHVEPPESIRPTSRSPRVLMARSRTVQRGRPTSRVAKGGARVFRAISREAIEVRRGPTGDVGLLFRGEGIEAVWVSKRAETIDRRWFQYPRIDLLAVLQGRLKVELRGERSRPRILRPGDVLVLPPNTQCRAYRWPRSVGKPTVFLAVYRRPRARKKSRQSSGRPIRSPAYHNG